MAFDSKRVVELVREFYREFHVAGGDDTEFAVVPNLPKAVSLFRSTGGHERRWKSRVWQRAMNGERLERADYMRGPDVHQMVFDHVIRGLWHPGNKPISAQTLGRYAPAGTIEEACRHGLGWLLAVRGAALIVPAPLLRFAAGRRRVFHDDTGAMAIEWLDGSGHYLLHGTEFDRPVYDGVIGHQLSIDDIAALDNIDQRAIALRYLTFEQLVVDSGTCQPE
jgi:hypothetical protein